jgi:hypothetical protein
LDDEELMDYFETTTPTREDIENCVELFNSIERGKGVCIPVYEDGIPKELFFMGYSVD